MASPHLSIRIDAKSVEDAGRCEQELGPQSVPRWRKTLIEEGLRMGEHPGIIFKPGPARAAPRFVIAGPDVWEVMRVFLARK